MVIFYTNIFSNKQKEIKIIYCCIWVSFLLWISAKQLILVLRSLSENVGNRETFIQLSLTKRIKIRKQREITTALDWLCTLFSRYIKFFSYTQHINTYIFSSWNNAIMLIQIVMLIKYFTNYINIFFFPPFYIFLRVKCLNFFWKK